MIFEGSELEINYSTSAAGQIRIEVQDLNGKPIPGLTLKDFPEVFGDEIGRKVEWEGESIGKQALKPVRLRFELQDADLYSFKFR